jgi:hypothetical protein
MNRIFRNTIAGVVAVAAMTAASVTPAMASVTPATSSSASSSAVTADPVRSLAVIQADAAAKIAKRVASLTKSIGRVTANKYLTDADRATILDRLNSDISGLQALGAKIAADTDRAVAAADFATIFTNYRVYAVALPQSHYAAAADALTGTVIPKLNDAYQKLSDALASSPKSTPDLQAKLADMRTQIDKTVSTITGVAASALAVTPAQYNANHAVLAPKRAAIVTAQASARAARADAKTIVLALK